MSKSILFQLNDLYIGSCIIKKIISKLLVSTVVTVNFDHNLLQKRRIEIVVLYFALYKLPVKNSEFILFIWFDFWLHFSAISSQKKYLKIISIYCLNGKYCPHNSSIKDRKSLLLVIFNWKYFWRNQKVKIGLKY